MSFDLTETAESWRICESVTRSWSRSPFGSPTTRTEIGSDGEAENGGHSSQLSALVLHCLSSLAFTAVRRGMWRSSLLAVRQIMVNCCWVIPKQ